MGEPGLIRCRRGERRDQRTIERESTGEGDERGIKTVEGADCGEAQRTDGGGEGNLGRKGERPGNLIGGDAAEILIKKNPGLAHALALLRASLR
ncbi:MAG: hypothetical protein Q4Q62_06000 [Thermoplasmata archaeon]|nr:hypothetical protein [Thermoplasmata archaeon]